MSEAGTGRTRGWIALAVAALTFVVGVGGIASLVVGHQHSGSWFTTGDSAKVPNAEARSKVKAVAEQFALRVDNFDGTKPDAYRTSVTAMLTTKYKAEFNSQFEQIEKLGIQAGQKGVGDVKASGVQDIDSDSATVLVVHDNTITSSDGTIQRHHRWTVSLVKVGSKWLVDDFTQVS